MEQSIKDLVKEIRLLEIKPNQVLCITLDHLISQSDLKCLSTTIREDLGCKVLITAPGTELTVIDVKEGDNNE